MRLCQRFFRSPLSANLNKVDQEIIVCATFDGESQNFENLIKIFSQRNTNQTFQLHSSIYKGNNNTLIKVILAKLFQIFAKIIENLNKNCRIIIKLQTSITPCK